MRSEFGFGLIYTRWTWTDALKRFRISSGRRGGQRSIGNNALARQFFFVITIAELFRSYGDWNVTSRLIAAVLAVLFASAVQAEDGAAKGQGRMQRFIEWYECEPEPIRLSAVSSPMTPYESKIEDKQVEIIEDLVTRRLNEVGIYTIDQKDTDIDQKDVDTDMLISKGHILSVNVVGSDTTVFIDFNFSVLIEDGRSGFSDYLIVWMDGEYGDRVKFDLREVEYTQQRVHRLTSRFIDYYSRVNADACNGWNLF